jgi:Flp pilus assembly protein TadG
MHNHWRAPERLTPLLDESGAVAVYFLLIFSALCGIGGLVVDYGNLVRVRAEVQRSADAAALAGAAGLAPYTGSPQTPAWASGEAKAHTMISNVANRADNLQFTATEGTVAYGYWLLTPPADYVQTLPQARPTTASYLPGPAIQVTLSRDVSLYLAPLVGVTSPKRVRATATAILPEIYGVTGTPPIAVAWDVVYNTVGETQVVDASEQDIKIQSNKGLAGWFNLDGGNSVPSVRIAAPLIAEPNGISTGSKVYMVPGTKATLTNLVTAGETIIVPVVQNNFEQKHYYPIIGWAAFTVDSIGSNSMTGHFVDKYFAPNTNPDARPDPTALFISGTPKLVGP